MKELRFAAAEVVPNTECLLPSLSLLLLSVIGLCAAKVDDVSETSADAADCKDSFELCFSNSGSWDVVGGGTGVVERVDIPRSETLLLALLGRLL